MLNKKINSGRKISHRECGGPLVEYVCLLGMLSAALIWPIVDLGGNISNTIFEVGSELGAPPTVCSVIMKGGEKCGPDGIKNPPAPKGGGGAGLPVAP